MNWKWLFPTTLLFLALVTLLSAQALGAGIEIRGSERFKSTVTNALALLATKAPESYQVVTNYIGVIEESEHSGMNAEATPPVFDLNDNSAFYSVTWCAGDIAHDSFHSKLYHEYQTTHSGSVPDDVWIGHAAEIKCLKFQVTALKEIDAPRNEIVYCENISPDYSDVPYSKRNW
jgi:hypothetical protein